MLFALWCCIVCVCMCVCVCVRLKFGQTQSRKSFVYGHHSQGTPNTHLCPLNRKMDDSNVPTSTDPIASYGSGVASGPATTLGTTTPRRSVVDSQSMPNVDDITKR